MPKRKIQAEFVDDGFGFPILLRNVPMIELRGVWTPDINYNALANRVLKELCTKSARLTGNELQFIRQQRGLTLQEFAEKFTVSHPAVIKWEKAGDEATRMQWSTEKDIRMWLFLELDKSEDAKSFVSLYRRLDQRIASRSPQLGETNVFLCQEENPKSLTSSH